MKTSAREIKQVAKTINMVRSCPASGATMAGGAVDHKHPSISPCPPRANGSDPAELTGLTTRLLVFSNGQQSISLPLCMSAKKNMKIHQCLWNQRRDDFQNIVPKMISSGTLTTLITFKCIVGVADGAIIRR